MAQSIYKKVSNFLHIFYKFNLNFYSFNFNNIDFFKKINIIKIKRIKKVKLKKIIKINSSYNIFNF